MPEPVENHTATVPTQPVSNPPLKKSFPLVLVLVGVVVLIGIANLSHLLSGKGKTVSKSSLLTQPSAVSAQQVRSYQAMQASEAQHDAADRRGQTQLAQLQQGMSSSTGSDIPGPEADTAAPMTAAQRQAIYGGSPNAPQRTSGISQVHAEATQRALAREKQRQDALSSDTLAIDFSQQGGASKPIVTTLGESEQAGNQARGEDLGAGRSASALLPIVSAAAEQQGRSPERKGDPAARADPMGPFPFDGYQGQLYRVFEGTVLEGVVTNHVDGGFSGPILVMLTTDYYSHDRQQLLLPQGTRLIGSVGSVGAQGQRKLVVTFHRAVCPDGFSLDLDRYISLDPIGTTGLATHVDNHLLSSFAAAAAIGGLGGLAQIGNSASILTPSAEVRGGISAQTSQESEQILNHFLNRLPVITLKEGSRARVYIGTDILIPSYAEHRVDPTL